MTKFIFIIAILPIQLFCKVVPDSLLTIDLQHKNITKLPSNLNYGTLSSLHIGYNPIKSLPVELVSAKNLRTLSVNFDRQFNIETSIGIIKQLKLESLSINNSNLMYLPLEIGDIKGLKSLSLSNNFIKEIPEYVFVNSNFINLNLSGNFIQKIPKEIITQINLKSIDISKNPCINDPISYSNLYVLNKLTQLDVRGAMELPQNIWNLKSLEKLDISEGTFLKLNLPLDANKNNLIQFTAEDCDLLDFGTLLPLLLSSSIKEITLGGKSFEGFSNASLSNNLEILILNGENLNHFSFSGNFPKLQELILNFKTINCQTELLTNLTKFSDIKTINLNNCNLTHLTTQFSNLKKLENLYLVGNKLNSITELFKLKNLKTLDVSLCGLKSEDIEKLKKELPTTNVICNLTTNKLPLPNAVVKTENFTISPSEPQSILTENGTIITIPKNSLVYGNGKLVKDPVTINFTPYYSLADIATSGINMNYQNGEINAPFTSAGMFNINAKANGENVELKKGAEIKIAFKSNDQEQSYNYYAYDSLNQKWTAIGKDTITKVKIAKQEDTTKINNNATVGTKMPLMPQPKMYFVYHKISLNWDLDDKKKLSGEFSISTNRSSSKIENDTTKNDNYYSELKYLTKLGWKIDAEKSSAIINAFFKDNRLFSTTSEKRILKLKPRYYESSTRIANNVEFDLIVDKEHDNFIFKFYNETDTVCFNAYPKVQNRNTDRAQKSIKKMFFNYDAAAKDRKVLTAYRKGKFLAAYQKFKLSMSIARAEALLNQESQIAKLLNEKVNTNSFDVTRILSLQGFGIYNCDRPIFVENPLVFTPNFYNEKGKKLQKSNFKVIDAKENIVVSYYDIQKIKVSKNSSITFIYTGYNGSKTTIFVGKLNTFELSAKNGIIDLQLSPIDSNLSLGDLNAYITSTY